MKLKIGDHSYDVALSADGVSVDGETFRTSVDGFGGTRIVTVNGRPIRVDLGQPEDGVTPVTVEGKVLSVSIEGRAQTQPSRSASTARTGAARQAGGAAPAPTFVKGAITAQMTGRIVRVAVHAGDAIAAGDLLLILEAMKMENEVRSPRGGTIKEVVVAAGDRVSQGAPLVVLDD